MPSAAVDRTTPVPPESFGVTMPYPLDRTIVDFFREQVKARPDNIAVQDGNRLMTYRELDLHSNRVANELLRRGLELEDAVMTMLPASCEYLAAIMGILKAGGAYFPLDTEMPVSRHEYFICDSQSRFVLTDAAHVSHFQQWAKEVFDIVQIVGNGGTERDAATSVISGPKCRAYITYTSGSTGQPKGVEIEHHSLTNVVCNYCQGLNYTPEYRSSMLTYVPFDVSIADIWPVLCSGGSVVVPPPGILLSPDKLVAWLAKEAITVAHLPPTVVEILLTRPLPNQFKLKYMVSGGDRLRSWPAPGLPFVVVNAYGPSEATVYCTWSKLGPENRVAQLPPIGQPFANTTAYVLDENLQPVPASEPGELYLGGEHVARGYLGRPELTRERFFPDPFLNQPGARMYRTGDIVKWLPNGELEFIGRNDAQVKIRGRRVELGEIESALLTHESLEEACCVPWIVDGRPTSVIAHVVAPGQNSDFSKTLKPYLAMRLPDYMVPAKYVLHDSLPLTQRGKLDRAALIALQAPKPKAQAEKTDSTRP